MPMLRIGEITYANCTPIFATLKSTFDCTPYVFVRGVPSDLNRALAAGDIDICISSSIELAKNPDIFSFLPDLSISSIGSVRSVFLLSRVPIEQLNGCTIGLTRESATSIGLLKIILGRFYGFRNNFEALSASTPDALEDFSAILLIGDSALAAGNGTPAGVTAYDLGEQWHRFTGLPFVFALWLVRKESVKRRAEEMEVLHHRLREAKRLAYRSLPELASSCRKSAFSPVELAEYWKYLSYDLTPRHVDGLRTFFRLLYQEGLISNGPEAHSFR
jgi:chorismate dehydratase